MEKKETQLSRDVQQYNDLEMQIKTASQQKDDFLKLAKLLKRKSKSFFKSKISRLKLKIESLEIEKQGYFYQKAIKNFTEQLMMKNTLIKQGHEFQIEKKWNEMNLLPKIKEFESKIAKTSDQLNLIMLKTKLEECNKNLSSNKFDHLLLKQSILSYWELNM